MSIPKNQKILLLWMLLLLIVIAFLLTLGCAGLTLGPRVATQTVIVGVGKPIQVLQTVTVKGRRLDSDVIVQQNIGGWVAMPYEHFQVLRDAAQKGIDAK